MTTHTRKRWENEIPSRQHSEGSWQTGSTGETTEGKDEGMENGKANTEKAKPCVFCGGEPVEGRTKTDWLFIHCNDCHADGPIADTMELAIDAWNTRKGVNDEN